MNDSNTPVTFDLRLATKGDIDDISSLFASHFPSDLTSRDPGSAERLAQELADFEDGNTVLTVAVQSGVIVGAAIAILNRDFSKYEANLNRKIAYLSKNVVNKSLRGQGIGRALVGARLQELRNRNVEVVYSSHHADNIGSAKALDAFGFEYVESFHDPERRPDGSQKTTIRRLELSH